MTNDQLDALLDQYEQAMKEVFAAQANAAQIKKKISGLNFRQAQRIARRGHWVGRPQNIMGWRPYQLLDESKPRMYVGASARAWTRKDYQSRGLDEATRKSLKPESAQ